MIEGLNKHIESFFRILAQVLDFGVFYYLFIHLCFTDTDNLLLF